RAHALRLLRPPAGRSPGRRRRTRRLRRRRSRRSRRLRRQRPRRLRRRILIRPLAKKNPGTAGGFLCAFSSRPKERLNALKRTCNLIQFIIFVHPTRGIRELVERINKLIVDILMSLYILDSSENRISANFEIFIGPWDFLSHRLAAGRSRTVGVLAE